MSLAPAKQHLLSLNEILGLKAKSQRRGYLDPIEFAHAIEEAVIEKIARVQIASILTSSPRLP